MCVFQENLTQMAIQCRNPPTPNAVCRYYKCHGYYSNKIYVKDPEFKVRLRMLGKQLTAGQSNLKQTDNNNLILL